MRELDRVAWAQVVACWLVLAWCAWWAWGRSPERPARALSNVELTATVACAHAIEEARRP